MPFIYIYREREIKGYDFQGYVLNHINDGDTPIWEEGVPRHTKLKTFSSVKLNNKFFYKIKPTKPHNTKSSNNIKSQNASSKKSN